MKRDEDGLIRRSWEELETTSFEDPAVSLADVTVTRSRAIKLAGAALASSVFGLLLAGEADARRRKKKRRRKKRRRKPTITPNPVPTVTPTSPQVVTINNPAGAPGPVTVELSPGFSFGPGFDATVPIAPGSSVGVPIVVDPTVPGLQTGEIRVVDANGTTVRTAPLTEGA
jgi:hypothetical protein